MSKLPMTPTAGSDYFYLLHRAGYLIATLILYTEGSNGIASSGKEVRRGPSTSASEWAIFQLHLSKAVAIEAQRSGQSLATHRSDS